MAPRGLTGLVREIALARGSEILALGSTDLVQFYESGPDILPRHALPSGLADRSRWATRPSTALSAKEPLEDA